MSKPKRENFCSYQCQQDYIELARLGVEQRRVRVGGDSVSWLAWNRLFGQCPYCMGQLAGLYEPERVRVDYSGIL